MNASQFYYMREVLGWDCIIPPVFVRSYLLHHQTASPAFLFFCSHLDPKGRTVIKKINKALGDRASMTVEITDLKSPYNKKLLGNLMVRFSPARGIVVFGDKVAWALMDHPDQLKNNALQGTLKNIKLKSCMLCSLSDLTGTDGGAASRKALAWQTLKQTFL